MERKTKVTAEEGRLDVVITREFDLPLELLFRAYVEPGIIEEWMTSKVVKLENKKHGSYQLEKKDDKGNVVFAANGAIHTFIPNKKIVRTFEMENTPFGVQLEVYDFEPLTDETSRLNMHVLYESVAQRDQVLQLGVVQGMSMAHDRIQKIANKLK
ncbi:MAG TPA: SRPBCC domain-containing protein [Puia sp.]|nr:SRPBCC domain-containing protein [Puia sp.]